MLNRSLHLVILSLAASAGCTDRPSTIETGESTTQTDTSGTDSTSGVGSKSATGNTSGTESSSGGISETISSLSESSTGIPVDPCPPGDGIDWPRRGAYLKLATEEDFTAGPLELSCSIERALNIEELEPLFPIGTVGGIELICAIPDARGFSTVYAAVTLPEAVPSVETLVGIQDAVVSFFYFGPDPASGKFGSPDYLVGPMRSDMEGMSLDAAAA